MNPVLFSASAVARSSVLYDSMEEKPFPKPDEAEDSVILQYPDCTSRTRSWKAACKTRNDLLSVACLAVVLLVVGSFVVGFFVGKKILENETGGSSCTVHDMPYNWGANVVIIGERSVRVVDWLDANMTAENMMKNLM